MTWEYEQIAWEKGFSAVCGVDEAGRGPLAGPVCAAAVILPAHIIIEGLKDSKQLSEKKRESMYETITQKAVAWSVSLVDEKRIDEVNILQATFIAMTQAVEGLGDKADFIYVDGNFVPPQIRLPCEAVIAGDTKIPSVAAASIVAKVTRDRLMRQYDGRYPGYGFARHKGYGTKAHHEALLEKGPSPIHRTTFLRKFYIRHPEARR